MSSLVISAPADGPYGVFVRPVRIALACPVSLRGGQHRHGDPTSKAINAVAARGFNEQHFTRKHTRVIRMAIPAVNSPSRTQSARARSVLNHE